MTERRVLRSPKLSVDARRRWYSYYAGYSTEFVQDALESLNLGTEAIVLDPWNGSGTTTASAQASGCMAVGFDLNPVLVVVAKGRSLAPATQPSLDSLSSDLLKHLRESDAPEVDDADPLRWWLDDLTVASVRHCELATRTLFVDATADGLPHPSLAAEMSDLAAVYYVALFETVRRLVRTFVSKNPTWVKTAATDGDRIYVPTEDVLAEFSQALVYVHEAVRTRGRPAKGVAGASFITVGDSANLPLRPASIDAVVTSPPYCTRIDYVRSTLPELAVLGLGDGEHLRSLREGMIGTPTVRRPSLDQEAALPTSVEQLLDTITKHTAKASASYYAKYFRQYFQLINASMNELRRVVTDGGRAITVVQDSYYKDVHVDLPSLLSDIAGHNGWSTLERHTYAVPRTMSAINTRARSYRTGYSAVEVALVLA